MAIRVRFDHQPISGEAGLITKGAGQASDPGYALTYNYGQKKLNFKMSNGDTRIFQQSMEVDQRLFDGDWHWILVSVDRSESVNFFVDAEPVGSGDCSSMVADEIDSAKKLQIGSWLGAAVYSFEGSIDEVVIRKGESCVTGLPGMSP